MGQTDKPKNITPPVMAVIDAEQLHIINRMKMA